MNKTFCPECRKDVSYTIKEVSAVQELKGKDYEYIEKQAFCDECNSELYIDTLEEENLKNSYDVYRRENEIIELDKIRELMYRYKIGKRTLSLLLGWGENTYSRYYDGDMPSKQYSEVLVRLYDEPKYFIELLEQRKDIFSSEQSYIKSLNAAREYITQNLKKIDNVAAYILMMCGDITHLALQKMLYYVQAFSYVFNAEYIFEDECEAWIHGPVYKKINDQYKGYDCISQQEIDISMFSHEERLVMDSVISAFGCYSGKILEQFTHRETPWLETRKGLDDTEIENRIIDRRLITEYFDGVKKKYNMLQPTDVLDYSKDMFRKVVM